MTVCWLRVRGGALIAQVEDWSVEQPCSFERNGPGESWTRVRLTDPSITELRLDEPVNGRAWRSWYESNLELAFWRGDPVYSPFETPEDAPTWAGPVVGGRREPGWRSVHAFTQEAYVQRSCLGHTFTNYLMWNDGSPGPTGPEYLFEDDPDLDEWDIGGTATATTSTTGAQYLPGGVALLEDGHMTAYGEVPFSDDGNYAYVGVAVYVPSGVTPLFPTEDGGAVVGDVDMQTSNDGSTWANLSPGGAETARLLLPANYEDDRWYALAVQVGQPAGKFVRYKLTLYGGNGSPIRFSKPKIYRPANVGAAAGDDIGDVADAIAQDLVDNLIGPFDRDGEEVGIDLVEPVRYFLEAHEDAADALSDWFAHLDWWVQECTIHTGQRGVEIEDELTGPDLSGWRVEDDASDAFSHLYLQVRPEDGPPDQIVLTVDEPATRLTHVVEVPAGMAPADAAEWGEAVLLDGAPAQSLTGVPVKYTSLPGERLADFMPGNWLTVTITEPGPGETEIVDTFQPVVDRVTWDPVTDEVRPTWVLGRKAKRDWTEMMAALLKQQERERRRKRPPLPGPDYGRRISTTSANLSASGPVETLDMTIPKGTFTAWAVAESTGVSGGSQQVNVYDADEDTRVGYGPEVSSSVTSSSPITIHGPATIRASSRSLLTGTITDRRITINAERTA